jgi:hypothetical protein
MDDKLRAPISVLRCGVPVECDDHSLDPSPPVRVRMPMCRTAHENTTRRDPSSVYTYEIIMLHQTPRIQALRAAFALEAELVVDLDGLCGARRCVQDAGELWVREVEGEGEMGR